MKRECESSWSGGCGKGKMPEMEEQPDADEDNVALKLEQLENAMGSSAANDEALLAHLAEDTNHTNPSDLSGWLESMLCEINAPPPPLPHHQLVQDFGADISFPESSTVNFTPTNFDFNPVLMACAEAVQQEKLDAASVLVKQIPVLAASQGGAMRKVAGFFADALARRIYRHLPQPDGPLDAAFADILQMHFYESCPYLKFAHFTANQAILEAFAGCRRVHVIDFGIKQGMQWPALIQALALRPGGPPSFRLTGIGPPQPDNSNSLQKVGYNLAKLADAVHVDFDYRGLVATSLADLDPYMLEWAGEEPEAMAVNSVLELHRLLARQGGIEKVLSTVCALRPRIVTVVEQEANHNADQFVDRFTEALHYYSTMFDSLESRGATPEQQNDQVMTDVYLGRQIMNVIGCEGAERTERHETLSQWQGRLSSAGFDPVHLGSNAFKQASTLLALFAGGDGYRVEEKDGCLTLGWHTRPLIATSAWRPVQ